MTNLITKDKTVIDYPERFLEQGTDDWKIAKLGHISGSNISNVMTKGKGDAPSKTRQSFLDKIVAERLALLNPNLDMSIFEGGFTSSAMEHGVKTESQARQAYEVYANAFVDKTGFWKHSTIKWIGCSPDGLAEDGLVEIKCPNSATHVRYLYADEIPSAYYLQMQCQMWVTDREWCDFVSFDPRLAEKNRLFVKRCYRSNDTIADMELAVKAFLAEVETMINILSGEK